MEIQTRHSKILPIIIIIIILVLSAVFYMSRNPAVPAIPEGQACTMEAKLCPDGSYVGRSGPNCSFADCPTQSTSTDKIYTDTANKFSFTYPEKLSTKYISVVDWPPQVQLTGAAYACTAAGSDTAQAGRTEEQIVNGHKYCVTKESEGAAGSTYTNYAYVTQIEGQNSKTAIFTFSTRSTQCGNYSEPQMTECQTERNSFNINPIADQIIQSFKFQ